MKKLFKAIEDIGKYPKEKVYGTVSSMRYRYSDGKQSAPIRLLATKGKYCLPETKTISDIIKSIPDKKLREEVLNINKSAGFQIATILYSGQIRTYILLIRTGYGAIGFQVTPESLDEEGMTKEEFDALNNWFISTHGGAANNMPGVSAPSVKEIKDDIGLMGQDK